MHNLKKLALIITLLAMGIGATANAATTAENKAELARTAANYDTFISNITPAETRLEIIPLPGAAGFPSYVDIIKFDKACAHLDQWRVTLTRLKNNDKTISLICETEDGGSVGVTTTENEASIVIRQTKQMNGNAIVELNNSFNIAAPAFSTNDEKCVEKIKEARETGNYGDVKIKFNPHVFEATCRSTCPVLSSFEASFKALDNFLTGHQ